MFADDVYRGIDREFGKFPADQKQSAVMAALAIAQRAHGWVSPEVIEDVAAYIGMPAIAVHEVATFYNMYATAPVGRFKLAVCTCLPCALREGNAAGEYLKDKLGIGYNETTADGLFTLRESECQGACGDAPVLIVNNERMCSFMGAGELDRLIDELRAKATS
ncbi:MAG: NADH-quinone oxidoreductase subunit NuoE [Burkholderiaceae bacterium]|nr:NADH-quinone oxidoreductase subunit NuoE [Burkholderiaceae bacterium]